MGHGDGRGGNVDSFDWGGQGESRGTIVGGHVESFDPIVADCAALLEQWIEATPLHHVEVGHSMGGHLLLRNIAEHRLDLAGAGLVATMIALNVTPIPTTFGPRHAGNVSRMGGAVRGAWGKNERTATA